MDRVQIDGGQSNQAIVRGPLENKLTLVCFQGKYSAYSFIAKSFR